MNLLNKWNRKFGKYAIKNLMYYIIILYALGFFLDMVNPYFYIQYLMLDFDMVLHGQIWRLVTFIIASPESSNIFFLIFALYFYYYIGNSLEHAWGAFRFNLYYLSGVLFSIIAAVILYLFTGLSYPIGLTYINLSLFFAFAALYPNEEFLLFFIIPVKAKYLAYLDGALMLYLFFTYFGSGEYYGCVAIVVAFGNFLIFYFSTRNYKRISPNEIKRKANFRRQVRSGSNTGNVINFQGRKTMTRHKCSVCGRTELDDENLEFRFCSKCDGNYEYCMDHLFTHEHVKKQ